MLSGSVVVLLQEDSGAVSDSSYTVAKADVAAGSSDSSAGSHDRIPHTGSTAHGDGDIVPTAAPVFIT